jgi:protein TonB
MGGTPSIQEVTTAADGSFQIPRVRPGTYRLTSTAGRPYEQPLSVTVADKDVTGLELLVVPVVEVTGTVAIEGTYPPPRIQLQLSPFKGTGQNAGISGMAPDGSFRASLPEGDYRVSWTNLPLGYEIKSLTAGSLDLISVPLKVSTDAPPPAIRVLLSVSGNPWVKVSGRVVNLGSMRTLSLSGPNSNPIELAIKPDGTFEIPQALPGTYQVRPSATAITTSLGASPMSVVIPNQDTTNLVITLPLTKDVPGIVVNSTGSGVEGRFQLNYSARGPNSSSSGGRSVTTQADGKFTIQISEGMDIQLSVAAPGYNIKSLTYGTADLLRGTVRITSSDTAEIRVVLDTTSTTISGGVGVGVGGGGAAVSGGVLGAIFTSSSSAVAPPPPAVPTAPPASSGNRINEAIAKSNLVSSVPPVYPALATAARVQGSVVLQIEISIDGKVQNASVVSGIPMLNDAAIQAVRQWTYKPFVLNGQTIPVSTTVTVDFALR